MINLNDIRIDNKFDQNINTTISNLILKDNNLQNKIYLKKHLDFGMPIDSSMNISKLKKIIKNLIKIRF